MKQFLVFSALIASNLAFAQAGPAEVIKTQCANAKTVVEFWHGFATKTQADPLIALVAEFNKTLKNACVLPIGQGGYRDLSTKITAAFATQNVPTIAQAYEYNIAMYLDAGKLANLGTLGVKTQYLQKNFIRATAFNGVLYGLPFNKSIQVMYYNKDLLKKYNASVPKTLDEFAKTARELSKKEGKPVFWFTPDSAIFSYIFFTLGGDYMLKGKLSLNSSIAIKSLQWLVDLTKDGAAKPITSGHIDEQLDDTYGFSFGSSASIPFYQDSAKFNLGVTTLLGVKAGIPGTALIQGTNLVIFKDAPKDSQEIAAKFLNFTAIPRNSAIFSIATGYVPASDLAQEEKVFKDYLTKSPDYSSVLKQVRFSNFEPALANWEAIRFDVLGVAIKEVIAGKSTVKEALDNAQKKAEFLLK